MMSVRYIKNVSLVLSVLMMCSLLGGCGAEKTQETVNSPVIEQQDTTNDEDKAIHKQAEESIIVTDSYGREVEVPKNVKTIIPLGNAPRMTTYLGIADRAVGIPQCESADSPIKAYAWISAPLWEDLPHVGNDALGAGEWYAEQIVACSPQLIICTYTGDVADDIQSQTGIPTIAVTSPALFSDEYNDSLRIIGEACGVSKRAETLIQYMKECLTDLENRTKDISDESKPTILAAGATFSGSHSIDGVYANYPVFKVLNVRDVAVGISEKSGGLLVDREQILEWNPDMIFFDAGSMEMIEADYDMDAAYFNQLKAVQNGELYQWPNSTWHYSNVEIPLVTAYYVGAMLYPDAFNDVDFEAKASEIFDMFLGEPDFLNVLEEHSVTYSKVTLGD
ncbi:MAG: hypothetical protein E7231_05020 [Cellulosilyticum sp.]|nr:hypothetical protein [Cellulosilyticum sp.]